MIPGPAGRRMGGAGLLVLVALGAAIAWPVADAPPDRRPNVIVVLTDDQRAGTFAEAMPWLGGQLTRAGSGWTSFPNASANTPLCCPSRASLLTGSYDRHTGVFDNDDGGNLDESSTIATWLRATGYRTALIGKYLNRYPFGRTPYVPAGWDRFVAKRNQSGETVYRDFQAVDQGSPVFVRRYATDWLAAHAVRFVRTAPSDRPFFLLFAPSAPHEPWLPAARHVGAYDDLPLEEAPNVAGALRGASPWVRSLPIPSAEQRDAWLDDRRRADEALLAVDDALRSIVIALDDRVDDTVIFVLSDNGYSFGEHRWAGKKCPYEACVRIPLAVRSPWTPVVPEDVPLSIVDLAPTILDLARAGRPAPMDGMSFAPTIRAERGRPADERVEPALLGWVGDDRVPAWAAVRTSDLKLISWADGAEELYDLGGRFGPADPWELVNVAAEPRYAGVLARLRGLLGPVPGPR
ncbi:MAG: sulfatase-like hydrolase/transferase [Actinomycetota bacterium]